MTHWWPRSVRFRVTALATVLVALVLGAGAIALIALQRQQLTSNLDSSLAQRADAYESALAETDEVSTLVNSNDEDRAVQVVDSSGVLVSTPNLAGAAPLPGLVDSDVRQIIRNSTHPQLEDDAFRILSRRVDTESGPAVLHVAQNIDDLNDTLGELTLALAIAVPTVVTFLAALVWWLVGRTLRPVELIRAEVAHIRGTDLHRRVPVPHQRDEIGRLATTMNEMLNRVESAAQRQRQFVADASHELRTPITRIRTEVEVDLDQPNAADRDATSATVLEEAIGLQRLLDNLLFLARSDEQGDPANHRPTDLDDIVLREVQIMRSDTMIEIDVAGVSAAYLQGDPDQLRRLVRNLLDNAVRHARTRVWVELNETRGVVELRVTDDGPGVPPEARDHVFDRFGRADDARSRSDGGAGLGLAIARDIVERHGGSICYDDRWTDGARFVARLPAESLEIRASGPDSGAHVPDLGESRQPSSREVDNGRRETPM